jgi:cytochrome c biogenesis protein CcdA
MVGLIVSLGLVDSLNPTTIGVGVFLGTTEHPVKRLAGYIAGIFLVYFGGGLVLAFGPASWLEDLANQADSTAVSIVLLVLGLAAIGFAVFLWTRRDAGDAGKLPAMAMKPGHSLALGATMTAIDLPTAFPYFGAIAAIVAGGQPAAGTVALLLLFNVCYVLPIVAILVAHLVFGDRAQAPLQRVRDWIERWAPLLLAGLSLLVGVWLAVAGASKLLA